MGLLKRPVYAVYKAPANMIFSIAAPTLEEGNQTMGHYGSMYEEFYILDLIECNFQSIYSGTPSQDDLIRSVARIGLSRDMHALP